MVYKGFKHSEISRQKMKESHKGKNLSDTTKQKISIIMKGKNKGKKPWNTGKHISDETKIKISKNSKLFHINNPNSRLKERNSMWKGGISFEPYTVDWKDTLKQSIRERDHYICQLCKEHQKEFILHIHHIDYNKKNCNPNNLISLCSKCHGKTNSNRKYWIFKFTGELDDGS